MTTTPPGALTIRKYRDGDAQQILATFNTVFREICGEGFVDRDMDTWRWQFLDNPAGTQILLAVDAEGTVASQYAAVPQTADTEFGVVRFVHIVDSMTHPAYRQGLQREGLFASLGRQFTADYTEHGNEVGYGFPVRMAERIGRRLLDYRLLRPIDYWLREPEQLPPTATERIAIEPCVHFPTETDHLWRECLPMKPCAIRKDRRYLDWRYADNPSRDDYVRLIARRGSQLTGVIVLRTRHELVPGTTSITDFVCHDDDDDTARALLREACHLASTENRRLLAICADHDPLARRLQDIGAVRTPSSDWLERRLTYRITGPFLTPEVLAERWRYSLGDTDLC